MHIFITANSPGEISGWVRPLVERLKEKAPFIKITLIVPPCQYASGREVEVARGWAWIDEIIEWKSLFKFILLGKKDFSFNCREKSCILFLGGDPFYAAVLSKKLKIPAFAYTDRPRWKKYFEKFLVTSEKVKEDFIKAGVKPEKVEVVGHLALDSIGIVANKEEIYQRLKISSDKSVITFLPGSRFIEFQFTTSFFIKVADLIKKGFPDVQFLFALAPFVDEEDIKDTLKNNRLEINIKENFTRIKTLSGNEINLVKEYSQEAILISDLVITIPGTNNLQIAGMGVPMLIVVPLNKAELIPLDGIIGLISPKIPLVAFIKRKILFRMNKRLKFISLPNLIAQRLIIPELRGILTPQDVAKKALKLLRNPETLKTMSEDLKKITRQRGTADKIAEIILNR